jgi:hypothetical protein
VARRFLAPMLFVVLAGCAQVIPLTQYKYPPRSADAEIELIDARQMERPELQRVFGEYDVIARFHRAVRSGDRYEADVASKVEEATFIVRQQGGHALLYTEDSELIAAIFQDVGYAGPDDRLVLYVLRRKED